MNKKNEISVDEQACGNCKFFFDGRPSVCRKYPPKITGNYDIADNPISEFPPVDDDDWCGEWQQKK